MADLDILITDENGEILKRLRIYLDGSDSKEAEKIEKAITDLYNDQEWNYV
jgi:sugar (pentulose or hexulose) kinase